MATVRPMFIFTFDNFITKEYLLVHEGVLRPKSATKKRLVIELDPEQHQPIKAKVLLKGVSMR